MIQEVARAGGRVGDADHVARVRGDEFALMLPDAEASLAQQVAGKVLKALEQPLMVEKLPIEMGASIGIAVAPRTAWRRGRPAQGGPGHAGGQEAAQRLGGLHAECDPYNRAAGHPGELRAPWKATSSCSTTSRRWTAQPGP